MKLKLQTLAGNHQLHYLTCKHKTFRVTVTAKFSIHAKIKYTELFCMRSFVYVQKIHQFLSSIKRDEHKRKLVVF